MYFHKKFGEYIFINFSTMTNYVDLSRCLNLPQNWGKLRQSWGMLRQGRKLTSKHVFFIKTQ